MVANQENITQSGVQNRTQVPIHIPINMTSSSTGQSTTIDYNHPLFLNPGDVSGFQLISFQLIGTENYSIWYISMRIALLGRNKMGIVDGSAGKDKFRYEMGNHWEWVNAVVFSWIVGSVAKNLLGGIMYAFEAQTEWEDLRKRFT
ncbi:uncharacterized protein LOC132038069 [Lycium ferocissimum]|uniref:uncharacterized protein LOC132038069 n=1 Tax=Lycium ferocissimum TaxID=112874 RepID=UPI0028163420|nr:uncharacterized protein LOC132038069 [Lycium ferocissimum]